MCAVRSCLRLSPAGLFMLAAGCSLFWGSGRVAGQLTLDGKPLGQAIITFLAADGRATTVETDPQGSFVVAGPMAVGRYRLSVTPKTAGSPVPDYYFDPATSGVVVEVHRGENELKINLVSSNGDKAGTRRLDAG